MKICVKKFVLIFFMFSVLAQIGAIADTIPYYTINTSQLPIKIGSEFTRIYSSPTPLNFPSDSNLLISGTVPQEFYVNGYYISAIRFYNSTDTTYEAVLFLGKKRSSDFVKVLVMEGNEIISEYSTGYFENASKKNDFKGVETKIPLYLRPLSSKNFYFYVHNVSGFKPSFLPELQPDTFYTKEISSRNWIQGLLQGILLMMILYSFFVFVQSRDYTYLYYALYIFAVALNFFTEKGLLRELVLENSEWLEPYFFAFSASLSFAFYVTFIRYFINSKEYYPKWDIAHKSVISIKMLVFFGQCIFLYNTFNVSSIITFNNTFNLIELVYGILFMITVYKQHDRLAFYFISGTVVLIAGTLISLVLLLTGTDVGFDPKYFMNAGAVIELLFFSLGLGYKMRETERDKQFVQQMLIKQLKESELMQAAHKNELEQKVLERTAEIEQQRDEIEAQRDEIEAQRDNATQQRDKITNQNKNLTDSIVYARRIQAAMLPEPGMLDAVFSEHFVIYKPRDIVSGDFYRIYNHDHKIVIAVGDATGHGVPGAFMSLLAMSFLNEIFSQKLNPLPHEVLNSLKISVKSAFKQTGRLKQSKNGFDIAVCAIDLKNRKLEFAGANQPIHILRNGEIHTLNPDKMPIGLHPKDDNDFKTLTFDLEPDDAIYLYTDGYIDQFGGPHGRKFLRGRFKDLLKEISDNPMELQGSFLTDTLSDWQGKDNPQIDDILLIGVRV
ncbi:MAG TPA: hypothetical protein DCQ31_12660 [Bacteroidales bacterium]|nr:hypothetical protein [Bacteroidales bacterium]